MLFEEIRTDLSTYAAAAADTRVWTTVVQDLTRRLEAVEARDLNAVANNQDQVHSRLEQLEENVQTLTAQLANVAQSIEGEGTSAPSSPLPTSTSKEQRPSSSRARSRSILSQPTASTESLLSRLDRLERTMLEREEQQVAIEQQLVETTEQARVSGVSQDCLQQLQRQIEEMGHFVHERLQTDRRTELATLINEILAVIEGILVKPIGSTMALHIEKMTKLQQLIVELATHLETHSTLQDAVLYVSVLNEFDTKLSTGTASLMHELNAKASVQDIESVRTICESKASSREVDEQMLELRGNLLDLQTAYDSLREESRDTVEALRSQCTAAAQEIVATELESQCQSIAQQMEELNECIGAHATALSLRELKDQQLREELASCYPRKEDTIHQLNELQRQIKGAQNTEEMVAMVAELQQNMEHLPTEEKVNDILQRLDTKVDKADYLATQRVTSSMTALTGAVTTQAALQSCLACNQPVQPEPESRQATPQDDNRPARPKVPSLVRRFMNISSCKNKYELRSKPPNDRVVYGTIVDDRRIPGLRAPLEQLHKAAAETYTTMGNPLVDLFVGNKNLSAASRERPVVETISRKPKSKRGAPKMMDKGVDQIVIGKGAVQVKRQATLRRPYSANVALRSSSKNVSTDHVLE